MDPFTQRMLERARARREKIDSKLVSNGEQVTPRKPLTENTSIKSPERKKDSILSPQRLNSTKTPSRRTSKDSDSLPKTPGTYMNAENNDMYAKSPGRRISAESKDGYAKSPGRHVKDAYVKSPGRRLSTECKDVVTKSPARRSSQDSRTQRDVYKTNSPRRNDIREVQVTKTEYFNNAGAADRDSDVSVEINIMHRNDVQIEVQVEERDAPIGVYACDGARVHIREIEDGRTDKSSNKENLVDAKEGSSRLRQNSKQRLDRLGVLYSDKPELSSPIHRTENDFTSATPPQQSTHHERDKAGKKKLARLAALADTINNWEDDTTHHNFKAEPIKKPASKWGKSKEDCKLDASTLDVSIHSLQDISKVMATGGRRSEQNKHSALKSALKSTFEMQPSPSHGQRLNNSTVAALEAAGYRRGTLDQSRLVYEFGDRHRQEPTATPGRRGKMAAAVAPPSVHIAKKPSIKSYKAPTPPRQLDTADDTTNEIDNAAKDVENNELEKEQNDNVTECVQTNERPIKCEDTKSSPLAKRVAPKLNGHNVDRNSVMSKAALFENGSPLQRDPAQMSIRERKALFEKNKGVAIVPKAPFGLAPSTKQLQGDNKATPAAAKSAPKPTSVSVSKANSREELADSSVGSSGIKGKLAALFNKEQTISETTIADKFKKERQQELEMLQNRFQFKRKTAKNDSDSDSEHDPSERAPLIGSSVSLATAIKKPEIIANVPKVTFQVKCKSETALHAAPRDERDDVIGTQPVKRRSSQDSPVVLSVLEDVKRIKVHHKKDTPNGVTNSAVEPASIYPHLSDIETATSSAQDEESDCGGSSIESHEDERKDKFNASENWAETSFGRDMLQVVKKSNTPQRYQHNDTQSTDSSIATDLDDMLDEALDEELSDGHEGPTPPKLNKNNTLASKSFTYKGGSPDKQHKAEFKSPLKMTATPAKGSKEELVHSVSFYRRMQNASSTPTTPVRVVRHKPEEEDQTGPEQTDRVTTLRERIKELQQEISKQQTVISQASQALNLCAATIEFSGSTEQAEGERLLLLATHRRQACLHEVQRLQVEGPGPAATPGCASLCIKDLTVPLRRDYMRQLNADGAVGHHCVCLLKCRDRVIATSMQLTKPSHNTVHFPDQIRMEGLTSDFKVTVEVYLLQASKEVLPHDVKYHIFNKKPSSKLLTPKSKHSELKTPKIQSPGGPMSVRSPQFQPHGYCIFAIQQAKRTSFTLNKVPHSSPLDGNITVNVAARVTVPAPAPHAAFLTAFDDVSGLGAWHRRWCQLQPPRLSYWKYPDDVKKKLPMGDIDLTTVVSERVVRAPRDLCARPHTLLLESSVPPGLVVPESGSLVYHTRHDGSVVRRHLLAADTSEDRDVWLDCLNRALEYVRCCQNDE